MHRPPDARQHVIRVHNTAQDTQTHKPTDTHTLYTIRCVKYHRICAHKPNGDTIHDYITAGRGVQDEGSRPYKFYKFHKMRAQGPTRPGVQIATESNSIDFLLRLEKHTGPEGNFQPGEFAFTVGQRPRAFSPFFPMCVLLEAHVGSSVWPSARRKAGGAQGSFRHRKDVPVVPL